jgi:hypothetical protein
MHHRSLDKDKADSFLFDAPKMGFNSRSANVHGLVVPLRRKGISETSTWLLQAAFDPYTEII